MDLQPKLLDWDSGLHPQNYRSRHTINVSFLLLLQASIFQLTAHCCYKLNCTLLLQETSSKYNEVVPPWTPPIKIGCKRPRCRSHPQIVGKGKLKNQNNLLMKLAGSTWGASTNTLRSSALALCYSAAEYCAPVCSHKSGLCAVELYHAPHLWYPPFYISPMASSVLQHCSASPMKEGCHWEAAGENRQT